MGKKGLLLGLFLYGLLVVAQTSVSGQLDTALVPTNQQVHLGLVSIDELSEKVVKKPIGSVSIDANGFFSFPPLKIDDKDAVYRIYVERVTRALERTLGKEQRFILSNNDRIRFEKGDAPFSSYSNTNKADAEWKRLRKYEATLFQRRGADSDSISFAYVNGVKEYAKDSLRILMVKLIGIKQLDTKDLLEKDIAKNPAYYIALLKELKKSDLDRSDYLFLENKLAFLTAETAENKFRASTILNLVLLGLLTALVWMLLHQRNRKKTWGLTDLSKQERTIQHLILEGKSNKEIAGTLFISLSTVKTHITNIYSKLQVSSRKELFQRSQN